MKLPLTISLLASSRIGSLERCLDSLKPLLVKVPAELIVVFTGTDERVREIAERYTDQIIPFTWCDDFAAARNAGLKRAKGEWFMYIDAASFLILVGAISIYTKQPLFSEIFIEIVKFIVLGIGVPYYFENNRQVRLSMLVFIFTAVMDMIKEIIKTNN